jgi:hypothetical protein
MEVTDRKGSARVLPLALAAGALSAERPPPGSKAIREQDSESKKARCPEMLYCAGINKTAI